MNYGYSFRTSVLNYSRIFRCLTDTDLEHLGITAEEKSDLIEEVTTEIYVYLGMLYHLIEVFKGHDEFADELSEFHCAYFCS